MVQWEYDLGPLKVNFRVLLEPKGFLRIIVFFIALLAFSITAGFNSGSRSNSLSCQGNANNYTAFISFSYPYDSGSFGFTPVPNANISDSPECQSAADFDTKPLSTSAQFFVAMGILTMIYVIVALVVYMMFITPALFMAKWIVIGDFFLTILFGVLYVIACIAWSAGAAQLNGYLSGSLEDYAVNCLGCPRPGVKGDSSLQSFAQAAISLLFGYLASFIWLSSAWFVYKDTVWHKDKTGPLASLYNISGGGGDGGGGGDSESK